MGGKIKCEGPALRQLFIHEGSPIYQYVRLKSTRAVRPDISMKSRWFFL